MVAFLLRLLNMSFGGAVVIAAILPIRLLLKKAPHKYTVLLWALAAVRLLLPVSVTSPTSVTPDVRQFLPAAAENVVFLPEGSPAGEINVPPAVSGEESGGNTDFVPTPEAPAVVQPSAGTPVGQGTLIQPEPVKTAAPLSVPTLLFAVWAAGGAGMLLYALLSYLRLRRKTAARLKTEKGVYVCDALPGPFVVGVFRPKIFLPSDLPEETKDAVLAHEKAHIRRRDPLVKLLGFFVLTLHWFNPLVWAAYLLLGRDLELAADESALKNVSPGEKKVYAEALLTCANSARKLNVAPLGFGEIGIRQRIKNMSVKKKLGVGLAILTVLAVIAVAVFLLPEKKEPNPETEPEPDTKQTSEEREVLKEASPKITLKKDGPEDAGPAFEAAKTCLLRSALQSFGQGEENPLLGTILDVRDDPALPGLMERYASVLAKTARPYYADQTLGDGSVQPFWNNLSFFGKRGRYYEQTAVGETYVFIDLGYTLLDETQEEGVAILSIREDADYQYTGVDFPSGHGIRYTVTLFYVGDAWRVAAVESDELYEQWNYRADAFAADPTTGSKYGLSGGDEVILYFDGTNYLFRGEGEGFRQITAFAGVSGTVRESGNPSLFYVNDDAIMKVVPDRIEISAKASDAVYPFYLLTSAMRVSATTNVVLDEKSQPLILPLELTNDSAEPVSFSLLGEEGPVKLDRRTPSGLWETVARSDVSRAPTTFLQGHTRQTLDADLSGLSLTPGHYRIGVFYRAEGSETAAYLTAFAEFDVLYRAYAETVTVPENGTKLDDDAFQALKKELFTPKTLDPHSTHPRLARADWLFTSYYSDPRDMDLSAVIHCLGYIVSDDDREPAYYHPEEYALWKDWAEAAGHSPERYVILTKLETLDAYLSRYFGLTTKDLNRDWLSETDAPYSAFSILQNRAVLRTPPAYVPALEGFVSVSQDESIASFVPKGAIESDGKIYLYGVIGTNKRSVAVLHRENGQLFIDAFGPQA